MEAIKKTTTTTTAYRGINLPRFVGQTCKKKMNRRLSFHRRDPTVHGAKKSGREIVMCKSASDESGRENIVCSSKLQFTFVNGISQ